MIKALQFHRITPKFQLCGTWNTPGQFTIFLDQLLKLGSKVDLPKESDRGIIVAFDDGEDTIYKYAFPILKRFNIRALVFLVVNYIGKDNLWDISMTGKHFRHLTWDQIFEMKKWGIEFGSHTMSHRNLTLMSKQEVEYEIFESKNVLDQKIGGCRSISYPFNRVNQRIVEAVSKAGYEFGFGGDGRSLLALKKEGMYITDTAKSLRTKVLEKPAVLYRYDRLKQKVINFFTIATMLSRQRKGIC
jgi:peptidoglycan/xylan/chitin deacetylase (PgdA/CDA1 family)